MQAHARHNTTQHNTQRERKKKKKGEGKCNRHAFAFARQSALVAMGEKRGKDAQEQCKRGCREKWTGTGTAKRALEDERGKKRCIAIRCEYRNHCAICK